MNDEGMTMGLLNSEKAYWEFLGQCTQCGHCTPSCESLTAAGMTLGDIAKGMLEAQQGATSREELAQNIFFNGDLTQAVRGCFFCTTCKNTCFAHNDVDELILHARDDFQSLGLIPRDTYSTVEVDKEWDIFTTYRAIYGIDLTDLTPHIATEGHEAAKDCKIAFFPGCSLAAYGPDLTREIFETLEDLGGKTTMIDHCCGSPLKSAGFWQRALDLNDRSCQEIADSGAEVLVCVCPGCANALRVALERNSMDVQVVSLSAFLSEHGFVPKHPMPDGPFSISKACQDRDGSYLKETTELLGLDADAVDIFHGCCGAGGAVNAFEPARCDEQSDVKLSFAPDGSTVITMCPTCTYTYAFRLMNGDSRGLSNKHYAELLFDNQFDWDLVSQRLSSMWTGEYGPWLAQVFA